MLKSNSASNSARIKDDNETVSLVYYRSINTEA